MSKKLPSGEQALQLLQDNNCPQKVINHCKAVAKLAIETAQKCRKKGLNVDVELVEIGALLHDIGRSKTHTVHHAIIGAQILKAVDLPEPVISIIKKHVGGGITTTEAQQLDWPKDNYIPETLEEKIVSYADKLIEGTKQAPIEITLEQLTRKHGQEAADRVIKIHKEITEIIGEPHDHINPINKSA